MHKNNGWVLLITIGEVGHSVLTDLHCVLGYCHGLAPPDIAKHVNTTRLARGVMILVLCFSQVLSGRD